MLHRKLVKESEWNEVKLNLQSLNTTVANATKFVREIEHGNLDVALEENESSSELNISLIAMRDQMKKFSLAEQERSWVNEGLARFVDILRSRDNDTLKRLSENILQNLVSYLKANQGALFLVNDDDEQNIFLEMSACYAYDRKKHLEKQLALGEGMAGQAVLEKGTIYMTDIPKDFVKITSGLGEVLPRNLLVVPLKLEDQVYGVVEIASFNLIKPYQIEFVEKLGESIASTIAGVRGNERTKILLQETQGQAEELRSQEEEMRQSMEELSATQEEMKRVMSEVELSELYVKLLLNVTPDSIFTLDRDYKLVTWNKAMQQTLEGFGRRCEKGTPVLEWFSPGKEQNTELNYYNRVFAGEVVEFTNALSINGDTYHFSSVYAPLRNKEGNVFEVAVFSKDVTETVNAHKQAEQLMQQAQSQQLFTKGILDSSSDMIATIDRQYRITNFNRALYDSYKQMGMSVEIGFELLNLVRPDDRPRFIEKYEQAFAGKQASLHEHYVFEGIDQYILFVFTPMRNDKNEIDVISIFAKDTTEITKAHNVAQQQNEQLLAQEEELRQNMEELAATQDTINRQYVESEKIRQELEVRETVLGLTTILSESDLHGTITYVNDKLCEVSQYSREELIGKPHNLFRHPDMPKDLFKKLWTNLKAGKEFRGIIKNKKKDGTHYWVDATVIPVRNADDKIIKYVSARYYIENDKHTVERYKAQFVREGEVVV